MQSIPRFAIIFYFLFSFLFTINLFSSTTQLFDLKTKIQEFCGDIYSLLPPIAMLLVIAAAVTFAAGQLASAETRARATSWATAMVVGALFAFVIVSLIPSLITVLYNPSSGDWTEYCRIK